MRTTFLVLLFAGFSYLCSAQSSPKDKETRDAKFITAQNDEKSFADAWASKNEGIRLISLKNLQQLSVVEQQELRALNCFVYNGDFPTKAEIQAYEASLDSKKEVSPTVASETNSTPSQNSTKVDANKEKQKYTPAAFYIINDKPVTREQYMYHLAEESKKSNPVDKK